MRAVPQQVGVHRGTPAQGGDRWPTLHPGQPLRGIPGTPAAISSSPAVPIASGPIKMAAGMRTRPKIQQAEESGMLTQTCRSVLTQLGRWISK